MHYFSYISHTLSLKNNLEKAVNKFLHEHERELMDERELADYKKLILDGIAKLNSEFVRCHPVKASWWNPEKRDLHLSGVGFCIFNLYASKN